MSEREIDNKLGHLAMLRLQRVELAHLLRSAQDNLDDTKTQVTAAIIRDAGDTLGSNKETRERKIDEGLTASDEYVKARSLVRFAQADLDRVDAQIESLRDERRQQEIDIKLGLLRTLERRGVIVDEKRHNADSTALNEFADEIIFDLRHYNGNGA